MKQKEAIFNGKLLPEYIFTIKFENIYVFNDELLSVDFDSEYVFNLINNLTNKGMDKYLFIDKLIKTNNVQYYKEVLEIKSIVRSKFISTINRRDEIGAQIFLSPCENPTILYGENNLWAIYYLYEAELVLIACQFEITMNKSLNKQFIGTMDTYIQKIYPGKNEWEIAFIKNYSSQ